jgi:hypothetical protein
MASLESQISSLRDELATVYKTQGQNAQRLLSMNETLREKEEASRLDTENLRKTREEVATLRKRVEQHAELMAEKDRTAQVKTRAIILSSCIYHFPLTRPQGPARRDQHAAARARSDRGAEPDPLAGQRQAAAAVARREAARGQQDERGERFLRGLAVQASGCAALAGRLGSRRRRGRYERRSGLRVRVHARVGKRGSEGGRRGDTDEGWDTISTGEGRGSDTEWLVIDDNDDDGEK